MASSQYTARAVLFTGSPFKPDYQHTLMPCPMGTKLSWFMVNCNPHFTQNNIMTVKINTVTGAGVLRLEAPIAEVSGYNYVYIDSKREAPYFAFVLGYKYVNDGGTLEGYGKADTAVYEFTIQKDVLMSHVIETGTDDEASGFRQCSIIRHHSTEKFNSPWGQEDFGGTAVAVSMNRISQIETNESLAIVQYVQSNTDDEVTACGSTVGNVPSGCRMRAFYPQDARNIEIFITNVVKKGSDVQGIFLAPRCLISELPTTGDGLVVDDGCTVKDTRTVGVGNPEDGVLLTNNRKCRYFPYNFIRVYNDAGNSMDLKWEQWTKTTEVGGRSLGIEGMPLPPVTVECFPIGYMHQAEYFDGGSVIGHKYSTPCSHKLSLTNYPVGSWINDSYAMAVGSGQVFDVTAAMNGDWGGMKSSLQRMIAGGGANSAMGTAKGGYELGASMASGGAAGVVGGGVVAAGAVAATQIFSAVAAEYRSETLGGNPNSNSAAYSNRHKYFTWAHMALNKDDMLALDRYFDMFGYAQNGIVRKPNPHGRPKWCFIQTAGLTYVPAQNPCNANELTIINNAFNSGLTMWSNSVVGSLVGNYTQGGNGTDTIPEAKDCADIYCTSQQ